MRIFLFTLMISNLFATHHDYDVTSGIVRRNWSLKKEVQGSQFHIRWFSSKEACETWKDLFHYENSKCELVK